MLTYRASERIAFGIATPDGLRATRILVSAFERMYGSVETRKYDQLARDMARVATPYAPCTDLPKENL